MKTKICLASLLLSLAFSAQAQFTIDVDACAGDEFIEDENGDFVVYDPEVHVVTAQTAVKYSNTILIPHFAINAGRKTKMYFYNQSNRDVTFFYSATYYNASTGDEVNASHETYHSTFSGQAPQSITGALLKANSVGMVEINFTNTDRYGNARVKWLSDSCGKAPILGTVEMMWYQQFSGGRGSVDHFFLNNGVPW